MSRSVVVVVLGLALFAGCNRPSPTSSTLYFSLTQAPGPPLEGPSRTFTFSSQAAYPVSEGTKRSSFVLYDNGAFALQSNPARFAGRYTQANGRVEFAFHDGSSGGAWTAIGTLSGDFLTVRYNITMQLSDFEDAVYVLNR
jgi:hypothetical protein